jgi:hypothetical protein
MGCVLIYTGDILDVHEPPVPLLLRLAWQPRECPVLAEGTRLAFHKQLGFR